MIHDRVLNCFKKGDVVRGIQLEQGRDKEWWEVEPGQQGQSLELHYHSNTCSICEPCVPNMCDIKVSHQCGGL